MKLLMQADFIPERLIDTERIILTNSPGSDGRDLRLTQDRMAVFYIFLVYQSD